jgi:hypothetical protein
MTSLVNIIRMIRMTKDIVRTRPLASAPWPVSHLLLTGPWCPARLRPLAPLPTSPSPFPCSRSMDDVGAVSWPYRCQPCPCHLASCCAQPPAPTPSTPRPRIQPWTAAARPPVMRLRGVLSATAGKPETGRGLLPPPASLYARAGHHINKFVYIAFISRRTPA